MKYVPKAITRFAGSSSLKFRAKSPTILVVSGVVGLGVSAVLAAKATRNLDPVLDQHRKERIHIDELPLTKKESQKELAHLYANTSMQLGKVYGTSIAVGVVSAGAVLYGHKVLQGRHVATMAAYSGLMEQFTAYRGRVAKTLGEDVERGIYEGAHGEWVKDQKTGEEKLAPVWEDVDDTYLRPMFDHTNLNWVDHAESNYLFLKGVQAHANNMLQIRGHVFLNEVLDDLKIPRVKEGQAAGWLHSAVHPEADGDDFIDFGFMTGRDPLTVSFRNHVDKIVKLNFNIDGVIWDKI